MTDEIRWAYCDYSHQQFWTSAVESSDANWVDMDTMVVYDTHSGEVVLTAEHIGELHLDPAAPYGWGILGYYSASSEDQDLQAYDLSSGELVFSLEEERVSELGLQVEALFDGLLYVTTSDEQIVVDLETGEDIGTWEVLPESLWATTTGDYVHMSDGSLHLDWEYDPSSPLSPHHG
ncbi:hypothetical protein [Nesterenkonia alkaliphila]|uniref:Uncharacterized protein n=1 Tax=Nesterenkonia alkaliphila TaxID=1463631 RepID=A0A7K1UFC4_9MICC|nr:hypothetical protein [Nesterenkonia alkaliphila]MVT25180.1 hypothetical protein [Nesterenkonia alkaliphila]GFZ93738.1 hypothetical protein GCM10011359_24100 [Nesterenkonia alkaliphila]